MRSVKSKKPFIKASGISIGLAAFLVAGLSGCDGSNVHDQDCRDLKYAPKWKVEECQQRNRTTATNWVPINTHYNSGTRYVDSYVPQTTKTSPVETPTPTKSGFFSSGSSRSSVSSSSSGG